MVRPVLTYGCGVWHTPEGIPGWRKTAIQPLKKIQNQCLRTISGAYKSTSTQTLEHKTGIPPLSLHLDELALAQAIRARDGLVAAVVEETCQSIKQIARATLSTRGAAGPARRTLLRKKANSLLNYCPSTHQSLPERTKLRIAYRNKWKERWTKSTS